MWQVVWVSWADLIDMFVPVIETSGSSLRIWPWPSTPWPVNHCCHSHHRDLSNHSRPNHREAMQSSLAPMAQRHRHHHYYCSGHRPHRRVLPCCHPMQRSVPKSWEVLCECCVPIFLQISWTASSTFFTWAHQWTIPVVATLIPRRTLAVVGVTAVAIVAAIIAVWSNWMPPSEL